MITHMNYIQHWSSIRDFMNEGKFTAVIKESSVMIETILKDILLYYSRQLPFENRSVINKLEIELGKNVKGIESFELGPLIQILTSKKVNFIKEVSKIIQKDHLIISSINFGYLKNIRNKYIHNIGSASRAEAQYFVSSLEILLSFFDIEVSGHRELFEKIDTLKNENRKLMEQKGKISNINGHVPFYKKYLSLITDMEYMDTCYYAEEDPFTLLSFPKFKELYEQLHYSESSIRETRVVLNLANLNILPWILLYRFVRDIDKIMLNQIKYRGFYCHSGENIFVNLMHYVLLYNSDEVENGTLIFSLFAQKKERRQKNLIIQNKDIFKFMIEAYSALFSSCKEIDINEFKDLFINIFREPENKNDLSTIINNYYKKVPNSDRDSQKAIYTWCSILEI